jgi:hypothetical protein
VGCPVCETVYRIDRGDVLFAPRPSGAGAGDDPADVLRMAAMLDLADPGGVVVLVGRWAAYAAPLADMADVQILVIDPGTFRSPEGQISYASNYYVPSSPLRGEEGTRIKRKDDSTSHGPERGTRIEREDDSTPHGRERGTRIEREDDSTAHGREVAGLREMVSVIYAGGAVPLGAESVRAVATDAPEVVVRALRGRGRIVAPAETAVPVGVRELARDERYWVGERESVASSPVQLTPSASGRPRTRR